LIKSDDLALASFVGLLSFVNDSLSGITSDSGVGLCRACGSVAIWIQHFQEKCLSGVQSADFSVVPLDSIDYELRIRFTNKSPRYFQLVEVLHRSRADLYALSLQRHLSQLNFRDVFRQFANLNAENQRLREQLEEKCRTLRSRGKSQQEIEGAQRERLFGKRLTTGIFVLLNGRSRRIEVRNGRRENQEGFDDP
jgi:hypothetical protein